MSLCFHVIYTPGTVKPLRLLLYSLLKWSDCTFHLVANGCSRAEMADLQQYCAGNSRLSYQALPTEKMMLHGEALNYLQAQNQGDYFCFMDSDIYAIGEFLSTFLPYLDNCTGIFSGTPLRYPQTGRIMPKDKPFMAGPYTHTQEQLCLGTTFFAIYNNTVLTEVRRATDIGFTKYYWEEIPARYQAQLQAMGMQYELYDTAKLLNLMLHLQGHVLHYQPCTALRHIEAVSRFAVIQQRPWHQLRMLVSRWRRKLTGQKVVLTYDEALPYLSQLLLGLANNRPLPVQPTADSMAGTPWVAQTSAELLALYDEFAKV